MRLVFLLEEQSMKALLQGLLPRLLPEGTPFLLIAHEGKTDLEKSVPIKLRAWQRPEDRFVIVRDQDSADCVEVKERLKKVCRTAGRPEALVRIACRELESWYLADLAALDRAYGTGLASRQRRQP